MVCWSPEPPSDPSHDHLSSQTALYMPAVADSDDDDDFDDDGAVHIAMAVDEGYEPISDGVDTSSDISSVPGSSDSSDEEDSQVPADVSGMTARLQPFNLEDSTVGSTSLTSSNVWSNTLIPGPTIEMSEDRVAQVMAAMSSVTLPPSSIPEWASSVPEENWRQTLLERIQSLRKSENGQ